MKDLIQGINPGQSKVLVEILREQTEYIPGVLKPHPVPDPYVLVHAVGENNITASAYVGGPEPFVEAGDLVITRRMDLPVFKIKERELAIIYISDIDAVISEEIAKNIKEDLTTVE